MSLDSRQLAQRLGIHHGHVKRAVNTTRLKLEGPDFPNPKTPYGVPFTLDRSTMENVAVHWRWKSPEKTNVVNQLISEGTWPDR